MRIGRDDNFLSIESCPLEGGYPACRVEALATVSGRRFSASHDRLMLESSEQVKQRFADFEAFKREHFEVPLSEGGWLLFERDARGYIALRYRIGGRQASAAMEGAVVVEGQCAGSFCREFGALLSTQRFGCSPCGLSRSDE